MQTTSNLDDKELVQASEGEENDHFREHVLARLRGEAGLRGRYEAVLMDKA